MEPIGILYEHPEWFTPLFTELDRRELPYEAIPAQHHRFDPDDRSVPYGLVVNRVSPSAYLRGHTQAIFYAQQYLHHVEELAVPVVNGSTAYALEISKARQLALLARLGIPHPRSVVVNAVNQIEPAAAELEYPVILKPNIGGSGAMMRRFDSSSELRSAITDHELDQLFGLDHTAIVQEFHPPIDSSIVRVEALDDQILYAIRIHSDPSEGFNLCPADICQVPHEDTLASESGSVVDLAKQPRQIEAVQTPASVEEAVLRIFRAAAIDVGGVEYLESERDGQTYVYDVNALSNFVTDAPTLVGFDPFVRFVDYLEQRSLAGDQRTAAADG